MQKRLAVLDFARIVCSFVVLYFHGKSWVQLSFDITPITLLVSNGAITMVLFFLLSGFCLYYNYFQYDFMNKTSLLTYYKKRMIGIYPAYLIHIFGLMLMGGYTIKQLLTMLPLELSLLQLSIQGSNTIPVNGSVWFLSALVIGYFFFPFLASIIRDMRIRSKVFLILALYLICATGGLMGNTFGFDATQAYFSPILRFCEFIIGVILCDLFLSIPIKVSKYLLYVLLILWTAGWFPVQLYAIQQNLSFWESAFYAIPFFCALLLICSCFSEDSLIYRVANTKTINFLSNLSFTIFLSQPFVFHIYTYLEGSTGFVLLGKRRTIAFTTLCLLIAIVYYFIITFLKRQLSKRFIPA